VLNLLCFATLRLNLAKRRRNTVNLAPVIESNLVYFCEYVFICINVIIVQYVLKTRTAR